MHIWGRISVFGVYLGLTLVFGCSYVGLGSDFYTIGLHFLAFIGSFSFIEQLCRDRFVSEFQVLRRSFFLGWTTSIGILLLLNNVNTPFGFYMCVMSFFHYSEFLVTAIINPRQLSMDSFLLNQSLEYGIAALASWTEYAIEYYYFPGMKTSWILMSVGLIICILGELTRKCAMLTAWSNFTHIVQDNKADDHELITSGIYSVCRHPSYAGWFWWSVGTQILLMNPFCIVAYALASWRFFAGRIPHEEMTLLNFFGQTYSDYQSQVSSTGVPFVKGYQVSSQASRER